MASRIVCFLLVQSFICKVLSIYAPPTLQQYLHLTGTPHSTQTITIPAANQVAPPTVPPANQPRPSSGVPLSALALPELISKLQQLQATQQPPRTNHAASQPRPITGLSSFSALGLPNLVTGLQAPAQTHCEVKSAPSSIDSNVLNNLAIALQLLLVSNILNSPSAKESSAAKSANEIAPCSEVSSPISQNQVVLPNSNFVGSSGFAEPHLAQVYKPTRNSMALLSPYEALGSYSDSALAQYRTTNPRQDFQSPYSMMTDKDLFSMNDLF